MQLEEFIKRLENMEKDVDRILKAARLGRHEKEPMSKDKLAMRLNYAVGTLAMLFGFAALFMIIYFVGGGAG